MFMGMYDIVVYNEKYRFVFYLVPGVEIQKHLELPK